MFYIKSFFVIIIIIIALFCAYLLVFPNSKYDAYIEEFTAEYSLSADMVRAVCYVESRYDSMAVSSRGAIGVMQILPETGEWIASLLKIDDFSTDKLKDPKINIQFGCFYLSYLYHRFDEEWSVLAAYNAGEGRVSEWLRSNVTAETIPFSETKEYIRKVQSAERMYRNKKVLSFY